MHTAHLSGNTSGVWKSSSDWSNSSGFPGDVCVTSAYQDQLNAGFSKVCEILKYRILQIRPRDLLTGLLL